MELPGVASTGEAQVPTPLPGVNSAAQSSASNLTSLGSFGLSTCSRVRLGSESAPVQDSGQGRSQALGRGHLLAPQWIKAVVVLAECGCLHC